MLTLIQSLRVQAQREPTRPALACDDTWTTYRQLLDAVSFHGALLMASGRGPGDTLAIIMPNGPEAVVAQLAGLWAGMTTVLLPHACPLDELRYYLNDTQAKVLAVLGAQVDWAKDLVQETVDSEAVLGITYRSEPPRARPLGWSRAGQGWGGPVEPVGEAPSCLLYTQPGPHAPYAAELSFVAMTHRGHLAAQLAGLKSTDVVLSTAPVHGAGGLSLGMHAPLCVGAALQSMPWDGPRATGLTLAKTEATVWVCVASQLLAFHRSLHLLARPGALRQIVLVGMSLAAPVLHAIQGELGVEIVQLPGPAEVFPFARGTVEGDAPGACRVAYARSPLAHWHLVDDCGQAPPAGDPGWLCVGGPAVAAGYRDRPDTSRALRNRYGIWMLAWEGRLDENDRLLDLKPMVGHGLFRDEDVIALGTPTALLAHPGVCDAVLVVTWNAAGMPVVWACVESTAHDAAVLWETAQRATSGERFTMDRMCVFKQLPRTQTGMRNHRRVRAILESLADVESEICYWNGDPGAMW